MTNDTPSASVRQPVPASTLPAGSIRPHAAASSRYRAWIPTWGLITTRHLELRKRRGLMAFAAVLTVGLPVIVLGIRLLVHAVDPKSSGPAGSPEVFAFLCNTMAQFGFIMAATLGAAAGTSDLTDGVFRQLVMTGRSRLALYLARVPAGLSILLPLVAAAFAIVCLVTSYEGIAQPTAISVNGISVPVHLDQAQLQSWLLDHPHQFGQAFGNGPAPGAAGPDSVPGRDIATIYGDYTAAETGQLNPAVNEMAKIGLWIELDVSVGFIVGLGLGSLTGQRTVSTVVMIVLGIVVTPILAAHVIPYFLDGQRLVVGLAMDQLRPAWRRARRAQARADCFWEGAERSAYRRCRPGR